MGHSFSCGFGVAAPPGVPESERWSRLLSSLPSIAGIWLLETGGPEVEWGRRFLWPKDRVEIALISADKADQILSCAGA